MGCYAGKEAGGMWEPSVLSVQFCHEPTKSTLPGERGGSARVGSEEWWVRRDVRQQATWAMASDLDFSPPEVPESTFLENPLWYGLFLGAIFQLICVLALIVPILKSHEAMLNHQSPEVLRWQGSPRLLFLLWTTGPRKRPRSSGKRGGPRSQTGRERDMGTALLGIYILFPPSVPGSASEEAVTPSDLRDLDSHDSSQAPAGQSTTSSSFCFCDGLESRGLKHTVTVLGGLFRSWVSL